MVDEDGIYQVTYAELEAAGIPVATLDPRTFTLRTQGTEIALYVPGEDDGVFDDGRHHHLLRSKDGYQVHRYQRLLVNVGWGKRTAYG